MTSTVNNNDPSVHYSSEGWEEEPQRFGGIHAPTQNGPIAANLTLEFDGTGVAVVGFLNSADHDNVQDLLRCAVDTQDTPLPTALSNAQTSTPLTFCAIRSLRSAHHTLRVLLGSSANSNPLIARFVVFSADNTRTGVGTPTALPTSQSSSPPKDTSSPTPPSPVPAWQPASSDVVQTSMTASSPASSPSSPTPTLTPDSNMLSRTPQSTTSTTTTPILYTNSAPSSVISIPSSHGHSSGTLGAPGGQPTPILSDTPSQSPRHPNTAAIAGGIVGGIILLLLILAAIFYFHRRLRALSRRQIIPSRRTSPVEMRGGDPEQERGREQGNERDDMSTILKTPALKAWSPEMFSVQSPSHSLSPTSLDYAFTRPFSLASSISPDMQAQSHSSDSRRSSTKPLLSSTLRGNLRTSTGTAASTDEEWHDAQSSASAEDLSMRSVPSRQSWYAV